jgi:anti-anti-sigma factor
MELHVDDAAAWGLRRYTKLVAEELGLGDGGSYVQLEAPVSVYLALDQRLPKFVTSDAALLWDERRGWSMAVEPRGAEEVVPVAYLGEAVLPVPREVARFATRLLAGEPIGHTNPPQLRPVNDLPELLAAYARPRFSVADGLLTIGVEQRDGSVVLRLAGELDVLTAPRLRESITQVMADRPDLLILDLTAVTFLGAAGLAALLDAHKAWPVRVVASGQPVLRALTMTDLAAELSIHPTTDAAAI